MIYIAIRYPETKGLPLEEVARIFGDEDQVMVFSEDIVINHDDHEVSGTEVIGAISAVVGIIEASIEVYDSARKDLKLSYTFTTVGRRLPIILDTLQMCKDHLEPIKGSLPAAIYESLKRDP
ncbi:MAG: hypothetical protein M1823_007164 [Watsoniomyces obsoletus]|nr:MAG: hypothetical protein M1823_007164 [Watsoniomyces obsoletus]